MHTTQQDNPALIPVVRAGVQTKTATGYETEDVPVPGSPFRGRLRRKAQTLPTRDAAQQGQALVDRVSFVVFDNPALPLKRNDVALVPDGTTDDAGKPVRVKARIERLRRYENTLQCDVEIIS